MKKILIIFLFSILFLLKSNIVSAAPPTNFQSTLKIGAGLLSPTAFEIAPDGRIFILQRTGEVKIYKNNQLLTTNFTTLPTITTGDHGLLGVALDPDFSNNHYIYFYYTDLDEISKVARFDATTDTATNGPLIIYQTTDKGNTNHAGGTIRFGPDGKLYISIGDNGTSINAQTLTNVRGKILRINKDGTIPSDNPFVGTLNAKPEIWALGFRNPFRFQFDSATGNLYAGDVGEATWEEIDLIKSGKNYGWPNCEGLCNPLNALYTDPIYTYNHNGGSGSVTGGVVYHGQMFPPSYQGSLFFGDYAMGFIKTMALDANGNNLGVSNFDSSVGSVVDMRVDPKDGSLYYLIIYPAKLYQATYSTGVKVPVAIASSDKSNGNAPLNVNFSSTGSLDPNGLPLTYAWDFGDGTSSSSPNPTKIYQQNGKYTVQLTVSNSTFSALAIPLVIQVGTAPKVSIITPINNSTYKALDNIPYSISAVDGGDSILPDSSVSTTIVFHHQTHIHPFMGPLIGKNGQFTIPNTGEVSSDTWYEIDATATDQYGLTSTAVASIFPIKSTITINSNIPGLNILLDGQPTATPITITGVVNFIRNLGAPSYQVFNGQVYSFHQWSDSGALRHNITTQSSNTTYLATFDQTTPFNGEYFTNQTLSGSPALTRQDNLINFDWTNTPPDPLIPHDHYSVRWTKSQYFPAGRYTFKTTSDDGNRLYIDGNLVINDWLDQGTTTNTKDVDLTVGNHDIRMEYYQSGGGSNVKLSWDWALVQPSLSPTPTLTPTPVLNQRLGGLNLNGYCESQGLPSNATISGNNWLCGLGGTVIDMTKACQWQYATLNVISKQDMLGNPYSWSCYSSTVSTPTNTPTPIATNTPTPTFTNIKLGGINLSGYCNNLGFSGVTLTNNIWYCNSNSVAIDITSACKWQYNNQSAFGRQDILGNPYSWTCYTPTTPGYQAKYWNISASSNFPPTIPTTIPNLTRSDSDINFSWNDGSPDALINHDNFVVEWTKTQSFEAANYHFSVSCDDGMRVYLDDQLIVDRWNDQAATILAVDKIMTAGNHNIKVDYYEHGGGSIAKFSLAKK